MAGRSKSGAGRSFAGVSRWDGIVRVPVVRSRGPGFSLIEVLVVVGLIAIAGVLAVGILGGGLERMQLRSAANDVAANLRFTRAHALATGVPQRFSIDPAARTWQAPRERSGTIPERLVVEFTGAREMQERAGEGVVMFFGDGASSGGRVRLEAGDARWDVDVAWLTGEVRVHRGQR